MTWGKQHGSEIIPTISLGVASMIPQAGLRTNDLLKVADVALCEAKRNGRNRANLKWRRN